jgi:hypothetical protein
VRPSKELLRKLLKTREGVFGGATSPPARNRRVGRPNNYSVPCELYPGAAGSRPNFTLKLVRPGFGPAAELPASPQARRRHAGCRSRRAASA